MAEGHIRKIEIGKYKAYQAVLDLGTDGAGQRRRRGKTKKLRGDAKDWLEHEQDLAKKNPVVGEALDFGPLARRYYAMPAHRRWKRRAPQVWAPSGKLRTKDIIDIYFDPTPGNWPAHTHAEGCSGRCSCPETKRHVSGRFGRGLDANFDTERLWAKVERGDGCWLWTGAVDTTGYGILRRQGRNYRAHRVVYAVTRGDVPSRHQVLQRCGNRLCCHPDHLTLRPLGAGGTRGARMRGQSFDPCSGEADCACPQVITVEHRRACPSHGRCGCRDDYLDYLDPPGKHRAERLDTGWWDAFFGRIAERGRAGAPLAPATVERIFTVAYAVYEQGKRWGNVYVNPLEESCVARGERSPVRPPTHEELGLLLAEAKDRNPDLHDYLYLASDLGERRGEAVCLRWEDFDLDAGNVQVSNVISVGEHGPVELDHTKNRVERPRVGLAPETVALLRARRLRALERAMAAGVRLERRAFVFSRVADGSTHWRPDYVNGAFSRLRARLGLEHVRPHAMRHFVATEMMSAGVDPSVVAARLGDRVETVWRVYRKWKPEDDAAAVARHAETLRRITGTDGPKGSL